MFDLLNQSRVWLVALWLMACSLLVCPACNAQEAPPDSSWTADATMEVKRSITDLGLGAVQGVVLRDGKVYGYGDVVQAKPRVGVIREYSKSLEPTGRVVWLRRAGTPLLIHPTGLTWDERWGTFLGDTIKTADPNRSRALIYHLDWKQAWNDGHLDNAVLDVIEDDAAVNGCRPEFVKVGGRTLLATADYGDKTPEIRLYDPAALLAAKRSSSSGVVVHRIPSGPFNQNLHWDQATEHLTCVQNVIAGRGWRLDELDIARAISVGRLDGPGVRVRQLTFTPHDELEGYWPLDGGQGLFAVARRHDNLFIGAFQPSPPKPSPPEASRLP